MRCGLFAGDSRILRQTFAAQSVACGMWGIPGRQQGLQYRSGGHLPWPGAAGYNRSIEDLREIQWPAILFWEFDHFVVLEGFRRNGVAINDPAIGHRIVSFAQFDQSYTGVCLEFTPTGAFQKKGRQTSLPTRLFQLCFGHWQTLLFLLLTSLLNIVPTLVAVSCITIFADRILTGADLTIARPLILIMLLASVVSILLNFVERYYARRFSLELNISLNANFIYHLLRLPVSYFVQRDPGEVVSRERFNDNVAEAISEELVSMVDDLFQMLIFGLLMVLFSWKLTLIGLVANLLAIGMVYLVSKRRMEANMALAQEYGKTLGIAVNGLRSIESIKASGHEDHFYTQWSGTYARSVKLEQDLDATTVILNIVPGLLIALSSAAVLMVGATEVMNRAMTIGELLAFQTLMISFLQPVQGLSMFAAELQELQGEVDRLDDVLNNPIDKAIASQDNGAQPSTSQQLNGQLEFRDVSFRYSPFSEPIVSDFCLTVQPGQRIALVGASGCGKSTIANLAAGLYRPQCGQILFSGHDRNSLPRQLIADSVAMVTQESMLFEGTVMENLTLWDDTIPESVVIAACRDALILEDILALPQGMRSKVVEDGANFSGGQRQRLEIATALIHQPKLLILDEAFSALDPETEKKIDQNLRIRGCTSLIIAHRLSTIRDCDEIIVLNQGLVVERGTHRQLWQAKGEYWHLLTASEGEPT